MATREVAFSRTRPAQTPAHPPHPPPRTPKPSRAKDMPPSSFTANQNLQHSSLPLSPTLKRKGGLCNLIVTKPTVDDKSPSIDKGSDGQVHPLTPLVDQNSSKRGPFGPHSHSQRRRTAPSPITNFSRPISRSPESTSDYQARSRDFSKHSRSASVQADEFSLADVGDPTGSNLSDISTRFLSRFPVPPTSTDPSDPNSADSRDEPRTPTIYHFRGASFEFVNPRHSLALQNIETPVEQESGRIGYFADSRREIYHNTTTTLPSMRPKLLPPGTDKSQHRTTPPRSLFDDLPTAYSSIRKKQRSSSPIENLPFRTPPRPAQGNSNTEPEYFRSTEKLIDRSPAIHPSPSVSFRKRFSDVFRLKGQDTSNSDANGASDKYVQSNFIDVIHPNDQSDQIAFHGKPLYIERVNDDERSLHPFQHGLFTSTEQADDRRYSDILSVPAAAVTRSRSTSYHLSELQQRSYESFSNTESGQDQSTEDLIASYGYEYGPNVRFSNISALQRHRSMPLFETRNSTPTTNKQADSTIGEILEQYHHNDTSSINESNRPSCQEEISPVGSADMLNNKIYEKREPRMTENGDKEAQAQYEERIVGIGPNKSVRAATLRALNAPSAAPLQPLPHDPSSHLHHDGSGMTAHELSGVSSNLSTPSYGDTRHLLLLSQTSAELLSGNSDDNARPHERNMNSPSQRHKSPQNLLTPKTASVANADNPRSSERSYEDVLNRDIKYLRRWSGLSDFQGSVYMVGSSNSVQGRNGDAIKNSKTSSRKTRVGQTDLRKPVEPTQASYLPVAAFQQSAVVPGILRLSTADRAAFEGYGDARKDPREEETGNESDTQITGEDLNLQSEDEAESGFDWETLPDSNVTPSIQQTHDDSFAHWSSRGSLNTYGNLGVHPGDSRLQHGYKLHSSNASDTPILVPDYKFSGGPGFPNRNALTPPAPAIYNTYKHPVPLSHTHENPFTSSPPQIAGTRSKHSPVFSSESGTIRSVSSSTQDENIPLVRLGRHDVSVKPGQSPETPTTKKSHGILDSLRKFSNSPNIAKSSLKESSSEWLSSGPGPEISLEAQNGSPGDSKERKQRPRSARLTSGVDPGLIRVLRQGDPRMASSPLSLSNSFNQLSYLGAKGNITGTPNGTGMREVGSSVIGTSSPPAMFSSSPPVANDYTPLTNKSDVQQTPKSTSPFQASSPLAKFHSSPRDSVKQTEINKGYHGTSFRDALVAQGRAERHARRVDGQKNLIQMTLNGDEDSTATSGFPILQPKPVHPSKEAAHEQLLPTPVTDSSFPKLRHRYRSPSSRTSYTRHRKRNISWLCFAVCTIFPFTLILYGHSVLDPVIAYLTKDEIRHFGRPQKKVAKIIGWGAAVISVLTVIILFVVIRTVPNNYSR